MLSSIFFLITLTWRSAFFQCHWMERVRCKQYSHMGCISPFSMAIYHICLGHTLAYIGLNWYNWCITLPLIFVSESYSWHIQDHPSPFLYYPSPDPSHYHHHHRLHYFSASSQLQRPPPGLRLPLSEGENSAADCRFLWSWAKGGRQRHSSLQ